MLPGTDAAALPLLVGTEVVGVNGVVVDSIGALVQALSAGGRPATLDFRH